MGAGSLPIAILGPAAFAVAECLALFVSGCSRSADPPAASLATPASAAAPDAPVTPAGVGDDDAYVGAAACARCHRAEYEQWLGSHHEQAMQVADERTVLGDFRDARFEHGGITTTFSRRNGRFGIRTDGPDGQLHDYEVAYVFGVYPLQQHLVGFPGGRFQVPSVCWDSRPADQGGQHWFHLYPAEKIGPDDELHWTGPNQNWNFMCAECHSTDLKKNYDLASDTYRTTWSELNVACEACHGPGSRHLRWAQAAEGAGARGAATAETDPEQEPAPGPDEIAIGLTFRLKEPVPGRWLLDDQTLKYRRDPPLDWAVQVQTCARCHSRRHVVCESYRHGQSLLDTHQPAVLAEDLYHADGQIVGEVYDYGSFVQSRMHRAGVRCTDCHDPHRLTLHEPPNALCVRCHLSDRFDTRAHHFHEMGDDGARCVACHMPGRLYMVVDRRLDHSIRVPRPDLSLALGVPNACTDCHADRDARWAADAVARWYGPTRRAERHYGEALHAGRQRLPHSVEALAALVADPDVPPIARATGLSLLTRLPRRTSIEAAVSSLVDRDPLVRVHALGVLELLAPARRAPLAASALRDPVRAVRVEAARVLAAADHAGLDVLQIEDFELAFQEFVDAQLANADRAWAHLNLGNAYLDRGWFAKAEAAYRTAIRIEAREVRPYVNLADLYRRLGREAQCEQVLRDALRLRPDAAPLHHALGLALVRQKRVDEAVQSLHQAATLGPEDPQLSAAYAIALNTVGRADQAIEVLDAAHRRHQRDRDLLVALATISRDRGRLKEAIEYARRLVELDPQDGAARELLLELQRPN